MADSLPPGVVEGTFANPLLKGPGEGKVELSGTPNPGKPIEITPLGKAFAGDTFRLQLMRSAPNPGKAISDYLQKKGFKPVADPSIQNGRPLYQAPSGTIVDAGEFMPGVFAAATGIPMAVGGAAQFGTEALTKSPMLGGAVGNVAGDLADRGMRAVAGVPREDPLTPTSVGVDAGIGAVAGAVPKVLGKMTGLSSAKQAAAEGYNTAVQEGANITAQKAVAQSKVQGLKTEAAKGATVPDSGVDALQNKISILTGKGLENARPDAASGQAERIMDRMLNKSPAAAAAERAQPDAQVAPRVAQAKRTFFDSLDEIRQARQAPFEKALDPIRDTPVPPDEMAGLQKAINDIQNTPGLNIRSAEMKKAFDRIESSSGGKFSDAERKTLALSMSNDQIAKLEAKAEMSSGGETPVTYGELQRFKNDAWRTIKSSNDPEERAYSHQFADKADDIVSAASPVKQSIKDSYALYKSGFNPSLTRQIAKARTPGEVGKAIFSQPEPVTLQVIDSAAKSPSALKQLQGAFADHVRESDIGADKLVKQTNPAVLRKLYGDDAEPLIRLAGPDMNVKAATWGRMIQASPEGRQAFNKAMHDTVDSEKMKEARVALQAGLKAAEDLPKTQHDAVMRAVNAVKVPEQQLAILEKALPDPNKAAVDAVQNDLRSNHWQRWAIHHGAWMALGALGGVGGYASGNKEMEYAGLGMLALPVATQALLKSSPGLAKAFVKTLDLPANRFSTMTMGKTIARILTTQAISQAGDAVVDSASAPSEGTP